MGEKVVEVRAPELDGGFEYEGLEEGDTLKFYHDEEEESVFFEAENLAYYDSIDELLDEEAWERIVPNAEDENEAVEEFSDLSGDYLESIERHGLYAVEIGERKK